MNSFARRLESQLLPKMNSYQTQPLVPILGLLILRRCQYLDSVAPIHAFEKIWKQALIS
jgi:hypothetical protein